MFVDYVYLTLIFDALSLITDIQPSTVLHISCIIFIEKNPYCSKFTLFKTRFLSLAHFYLLHKIGYATPWCLFYLQKTNDRHWYAIVGFSWQVSHIRLLTVRQLINWTFNINNYQFSNARVVFKRCLKSENCDHFMKSRS